MCARGARTTAGRCRSCSALGSPPTELVLYLSAATDLPDPFAAVDAERTVWTVDPATVPPLGRVPTAPWPGLVTVGQDAQGAHLLLELEALGALQLTGDPQLVAPALAALAVELSATPWAEQLTVTLVGVLPELAPVLGTDRVRSTEDLDQLLVQLRGRAQDTGQALVASGFSSLAQARAAGADAQGWMPEIVVLHHRLTDAQRTALAGLTAAVPRLGVAAVGPGLEASPWSLELTGPEEAVLHPLGMRIRPQLISVEEQAQILQVLTTATQPPHTPPPRAADISTEPPEEAPAPPAAPEVRPVEPPVDDPATPPTMNSLAGEAPAVLAEPTPETAAAAPTTDHPADEPPTDPPPLPATTATVPDQLTAPTPERHSDPLVAVLGPVQLHHPHGRIPTVNGQPSASTAARCTALAAFLCLNPGATSEQLHAAFWPNDDPSGPKATTSRNRLTYQTRNYLGHAPDGTPYFPQYRPLKGYRLHHVRTDWDAFRDLIAPGITTAGTEDLVAALRLVRGQPFSGVKARNYLWAETARQDMISTISDVAHEVARRALATGDITHARLATAIGRETDPVNEALWRDALRAEHAAGSTTGLERIITQLTTHLASFDDDYEPDEETIDLINTLRRTTPQTTP